MRAAPQFWGTLNRDWQGQSTRRLTVRTEAPRALHGGGHVAREAAPALQSAGILEAGVAALGVPGVEKATGADVDEVLDVLRELGLSAQGAPAQPDAQLQGEHASRQPV